MKIYKCAKIDPREISQNYEYIKSSMKESELNYKNKWIETVRSNSLFSLYEYINFIFFST